MKRNVMLGEIYNVIYKNTDLTEEQCFDLTKAVLDEVEELGMRPPNVCGKFPNFNDKKYAAHLYMDKDMNYWEPEDEEKKS